MITELLQKKKENHKTEKRVEVCRKDRPDYPLHYMGGKKGIEDSIVIPERNRDTRDDVRPGTANQILSSPLGKAVVIFGFFITYRHWDIINSPGGDNPLYLSRTSPRSAGKQPVAPQGWVKGARSRSRMLRSWILGSRSLDLGGPGQEVRADKATGVLKTSKTMWLQPNY